MSLELRQKSEKTAADLGFSSLQELVRIFLNQFSRQQITLSFNIPEIKLSAKNEKRYLKMVEDYSKKPSEFKSFSSVDDMMKYLHSSKP